MFAIVLLGLASLVVIAAAIMLIDCALPSLELPFGDPLQVCDTVDQLGFGSSPDIVIGFAAFAGLAVLGSWLEYARRVRKKAKAPVTALARNLERLEHLGSGRSEDENGTQDESAAADVDETTAETVEEPEPADSEDGISAFHKLVELEEEFLSSSNPAGLSAKWLALLREANDLHNSGDLTTRSFREINTRTLALLPAPKESPVDRESLVNS